MGGGLSAGAAVLVWGWAAATVTTALWLHASPASPVATPVIAALAFSGWWFGAVWRQERAFPVANVGVLAMAAAMAYAVLPPLGLVLAGLQLSETTDSRLLGLRLGGRELAAVAWMFTAYAIAMGGAFLLGLRGWQAQGGRPGLLGPRTEATALAMLGAITAFFAALYLTTGYTPLARYEGIGEMAVEWLETPLLLRQVSNHLHGMVLVVKLVVMGMLLQRHAEPRWRLVLVAWLVLEALLPFVLASSRAPTVLFLMGTVLLFHMIVRPLPAAGVLVAGLALLVGFLVQGAMRVTWGGSGLGILSSANEFQSIFATAADVFARGSDLPPMPWSARVSEVLLVPQQLLPIPKMDKSDWYLDLIGAAGTGVGLAFGVVAESLVGYGWTELLLRGVVVGYVLSRIHRFADAKTASLLWAVLYVWLCIQSYQLVRVSTLALVPMLMYQVLPVLGLLAAVQRWDAPVRRVEVVPAC